VDDYPDWLVVDAGMPRCLRCGAAWDRSPAAEADAALADREDYVRADAVLRGLLAFAEFHRWCGGGREAVAALAEAAAAVVARSDAGPASEPGPAAASGPDPGRCPRCGEAYRRPGIRRCYSAQCRRPPGGACPGCGTPYKKYRRCFRCDPTPIMRGHAHQEGSG
jgi:hypothetical protein